EVRRRPPELRRMRLMRQLPHEQREQPGDGGERDALRGELEGTHQAATMYTGVPTFTWLKSHSACGMCMRMQPCEREYPIEPSSGVPWMPTPGELRPIQRVPSGLPGPGGTGFSPAAHGAAGGYHQGFFHLTMIENLPSGVG